MTLGSIFLQSNVVSAKCIEPIVHLEVEEQGFGLEVIALRELNLFRCNQPG